MKMNHCMNVFYLLLLSFIIFSIFIRLLLVRVFLIFFLSTTFFKFTENAIKEKLLADSCKLEREGGNKSNFSFPSLLIYFPPSLDSSLPHCVSPYRMSTPPLTLGYSFILYLTLSLPRFPLQNKVNIVHFKAEVMAKNTN